MKLGDDVIRMGRSGGEYRNPKQVKEATRCLSVDVENVGARFKCAKKAGARLLEEPVDAEHGHRGFGAEDPEGQQWHFAEDIGRPTRRRRSARTARK